MTGKRRAKEAAAFARGLAALRAFAARAPTAAGGHLVIPYSATVGGLVLARWAQSQRHRYRRGTFTREQIEALESIPGWRWCPGAPDAPAPPPGIHVATIRRSTTRKVSELTRFALRHGHVAIPRSNTRLFQWIGEKRREHLAGTLSASIRGAIESVPYWSWTARSARVRETIAYAPTRRLIEALRRVANERGIATIRPRSSAADLRLYMWMRKQRIRYHEGRLPAPLVSALEAIPGWTWTQPSLPRGRAYDR